MRRRALLVGMWGCACLSGARVNAAEGGEDDRPGGNLHVYLLIGQSNMAGRAPFGVDDAGVIDGAFLLNAKDDWEAARNPLNRYSTIRKGLGMQKMNPGYHFALAMRKGREDVAVGLVVNAKGGTRIEQWAQGTKFYDEAVRRTRIAAKSGIVKGILWHQGESNAGNPDGYLDQLRALIADLRKDLDAPGLPFVAGQVHNLPAINDQIAKLPETVPYTGFVSSEGLTAMDRWHFDSASMKLLGARYAAEMRRLETSRDDGDARSGR